MRFRVAVRSLLRSPTYAVSAVLMIGLTCALGATVFSVVDAALLRPLPYPDSRRLYVASRVDARGREVRTFAASQVALLANAHSRIAVTAIGYPSPQIPVDQPESTIYALPIDSHFFEVLNLLPTLGGFTAAHFGAVIGKRTPAIVTHQFWVSWLGSDPDPVGRTVEMVDGTIVVAGVLPRDFAFPISGTTPPQMVVPAAAGPRMLVIARLLGGIDEAQALAVLAAPTAVAPPPLAIRLKTLRLALGESNQKLLSIALADALLLILLGAVNVASLTGVRLRARLPEFATRLALGATPRAVTREALSESLLIAMGGGVVSLLITAPLLHFVSGLMPRVFRPALDFQIDWRVGLFAFAVAVLPVMVLSLGRTLFLTHSRLTASFLSRSASAGTTRRGGSGALLIVQSAFGIMLVLGGSLLLASQLRLNAENIGFEREARAVIDLRILERDKRTSEEVSNLEREGLELVRTSPGVSAAAILGIGFFEGPIMTSEQFPPPGLAEAPRVSVVPVSGQFFDVAGLHVIDGRFPTADEIEQGVPVAAVSRRASQGYFGDVSPVGRILAAPSLTLTVVGLVEEAHFAGLVEEPFGEIYTSRRLVAGRRTVYLIKTLGDASDTVQSAAAALKGKLSNSYVRRAESIEEALARSVDVYQFRTILLVVNGAAALALLVVGVTSVAATRAAASMREVAIRSALGARRDRMALGMAIGQVKFVLVGLALGSTAAWWGSELLWQYIYDTTPHDPLVWIVTIAVVLMSACGATWLQVWRGASVDAARILRAD